VPVIAGRSAPLQWVLATATGLLVAAVFLEVLWFAVLGWSLFLLLRVAGIAIGLPVGVLHSSRRADDRAGWPVRPPGPRRGAGGRPRSGRSGLEVAADGEVVLRLFDRHGTIRVELGAGEDGSGLLLLDETTSPGVHLVARRAGPAERPPTTGVTLTGADGRPRVIRP
jgi:hypothetical protein